MALLEVKDLHTSFFTPSGEVKAVNGLSFSLEKGKVLMDKAHVPGEKDAELEAYFLDVAGRVKGSDAVL